ncbi:MobQ family relaxase [Methylobacter sp.]|uniref:MobQ family relaxase n=1 Tax=Methylobacter sp. TaxID=2051955 RepID=UPI003DA67C9A
MAIYHCKLKVINRRAGPGIVASAAYRAGERIRDEKSGKTHDYKRRIGIVYTEIIPPRTAPDWVFDRAKLWNTVESTEKRKDAQLAREIMVALPKELNSRQRIKLVRGYIFQQFTKKGMIADFAIHAPSKEGDERNYHAHILLTMRSIISAGFGKKVREWNAKSNIYQWRQAWENHTNQALEQAGLDCRVDCRSHASKGLEREPRLHLGYQAMAIERKGEQSERGNENRAIEVRNEMRAKLRSEQTRASDEWLHPYHDAANQPQAISQINDIDCSESDIADTHRDKSLDTIQQDEPSLQSFLDRLKDQIFLLEDRKEALERIAKTFEARKIALNHQIENALDEKTQDRLRLQEKLECASFTESYNKIWASFFEEEDPRKYVNEIAASEHRARKAGREYQQCVSEWNRRAVRDSYYSPTGPESADKVNEIQATEKKRWSDFAVKVEKNGWSLSRIEKESRILQERLDRELESSFGLEASLSHGRSMGR